MKLFVVAGANLDSENDQGLTPIFFASMKTHSECLRILIENGSNIDHTSYEEGSPIYLAILSGSLECTKLLVDAGCSLNLRDNFDEETPLDIA